MKKSIIALSGALLFTVSGLIAGEVSMISLKGNDPNFTKIFRGGVRAKEVTADGFIIKGNGPVYTYNTEKAIDPNASYELTIKVKYVGKKKGGKKMRNEAYASRSLDIIENDFSFLKN